MSSKLSFNLLLCVLLLGATLRLTGIPWGAPPLDYKQYHPDEPKIIEAASIFPSGVLHREDLRYPNALHHGLGIILLPVRFGMSLAGYDKDYQVYAAAQYVGRFLSVLLGTLCILLSYKLGVEIYGDSHGIVAGTLTAFAMLHVTNSAWATTDVTSSFFFALYTLFLVRAYKQLSTAYAIAAAGALGLAVGTKYTAAIGAVPALFIALINAFSGGNSLKLSFSNLMKDRLLWIIGLGSIFVFLVSTPSVITQAGNFMSALKSEAGRMSQYGYSQSLALLIAEDIGRLIRTTSPLVAAVFILGIPLMVFRPKSRYETALVLTVALIFFYFSYALLARYLILIVPIVSVLTSRILILLYDYLSLRFSARTGLIVLTLVLVQALVFSIWGAASRYPDSRSSASAYIENNIPGGASIAFAYDSDIYQHLWRYPRINHSKFTVVDAHDSPDYIISSSFSSNRVIKALREGKASASDNYRVQEHDLNYWYRRTPPTPEIFAVFDELFLAANSHYVMMEQFKPYFPLAPIEFAPPRIQIFKKKAH